MKIRVEDLEPGMVVAAKGKRVRLSNLPRCPSCSKPNYCEEHGYAYVKWYRNLQMAFLNAGRNTKVDRVE